jgi:cobalt-zinc-cadmium efflux system membrane fusion protein
VRRLAAISVFIGLQVGACHSHGHSHGGGAAGDHGHGHAETEDPRPTLSFTLYADGLELFLEAPSFVVGQPSPLVAHFTDARDPAGFVWVTAGAVTATLRSADGHEDAASVDALLRNGIFKPILTPTRAGEATLTLRLTGPVEGTVDVGPVVVHPSVDDAVAAAPAEAAGEPTVSYLKESQWKTAYATALATSGGVRDSVPASGELLAPPDARALVDSPIAGRLEPTALLRVGAAVQPGDVLARIIPIGGEDRAAVDAARAEADAALALAQAAAQRATQLHPAVVSTEGLEAAQAAVGVAEARVAEARARGQAWGGAGERGAELRAPIAGQVAFVRASAGRVLDAGAPVAEIVDASQLWLEARVFERDASRVRAPQGAMFTVPGREAPVLVDPTTGGAVVAVGPAVDPTDRTVPLIFAFANPGDLLPGAFVDARVFTADALDGAVVPASAVVDDNGAPIVFVMDGGESFFRRRVALGPRDGDRILLRAGVQPGERVVSVGAAEVLLATSAGGMPAHGHAH